jgi:hypothetical protein
VTNYDDASWHSGGDFPEDLPDEAGATHIGMFVAWALTSGLAGELLITDFPTSVPDLTARTITPGAFVLRVFDGKFTEDELNEEGNAFAQTYYEAARNGYLADYEAILSDGVPSLYHVKDTWENFDRLRPVLDRRFKEWKAASPDR